MRRRISEFFEFAKELLKLCAERGPSEASQLFPVDKLLNLFDLEQVPLTGSQMLKSRMASSG